MSLSARVSPRARVARTLRAVAALVALVALAGCTSPAPSPTGAPPTPAAKRLVIGATVEPSSMDPTADAAAAGSQVMLYNVYETLVKMDAEGELRPLLAQSWDLSADRTTYTFQINPAARFSDGTRVTAGAVAANIERIRTGQVAAKLKAAMAVVSSATATDDDSLQVVLSHPSNLWLYEMSSTAGMVMNPAGFADLKTATAGSGPLQLSKWNVKDSIVLAKNANYWGTPARFDEVRFRYIADANALNAAMLSGELDIISNLQAPDAITQFSDASRFKVLEGTTNGEVVMSLNNSATPTNPQVPVGTGNPALKDPRVRQALTMAIDKNALLTNVWNGKGVVLGSMAVPTDPYYEDLSDTYPYDPAKARKLLAEAGYPEGKLTLRLRPPTIPYATRAAQYVASQLGAVGVKVAVDELQFPGAWVDAVYTKADYDMTIVAHVEARDLWTYTDPNYYWRYSNPEVNRLVEAADRGTAEEYVTDMRAAERLLAADAASIWLWMLPNIVVTKAGITGVGQNASSLSFDVTTIAGG